MELDVTNLINKAQDLIHDGMMDFAAKGTVPVQEMVNDKGEKYLLTLTMEFVPDKID